MIRQVTNLTFRGGFLHVYAVLYRRKDSTQENNIERRFTTRRNMHVSRKFSRSITSLWATVLSACRQRIL